MKTTRLLGLAASLTMAMGTSAFAAGITTPPPVLTATGDVTAFYIFADAQNTSVLNEVTPQSINEIFCNHDEGACTGASAGDMVDLGTQNAPLVFSLDNLDTGDHFTSDALASDNFYHVQITNDITDFAGSISIPSQLTDFLAANPGVEVTYVGWEDKIAGSDYDYNDLIFAFTNTTTREIPTPEPMTLALLGTGLAGLGAMGRRKGKKKA